MTMFKRGTGGGVAYSRVTKLVILFLLAYFLGNMGMHLVSLFHSAGDEILIPRGDRDGRHSIANTEVPRQKGCETIEDYIEDGNYDEKSTENPWRQMKWGLPPAKCRVNGHLIERLDPSYNYRRGVALRFTTDLDDKSHIEHWFLGTKVDLNQRKRRVFIDLGANYFQTSVVWFNQRYPCDFTEVHAFEVNPDMFQVPQGFDEESNAVDPNEHGWFKIKNRDGYLPHWMTQRIQSYHKFAGNADDDNSVNITRFIKDELKLTEQDTVVIKMDIEGSEWPILQQWLKDPDMPKIIDELWLELHYYHLDNNWLEVKQYSREQATRLLAEMRFKGFYVHYWD